MDSEPGTTIIILLDHGMFILPGAIALIQVTYNGRQRRYTYSFAVDLFVIE